MTLPRSWAGQGRVNWITLGIVALASALADPAKAAEPKLSGGLYHSVALRNDGTVWAWGQNTYVHLVNPHTDPLTFEAALICWRTNFE